MASPDRTTLITTKLHRPPVTARLVPRPRLMERLNDVLSVPLTLVCAPAGFGKTTLVSSWIREIGADFSAHTASDGESGSRVPVAWLSLDELDSDLDIFLRSFIAAIQTQFVGAGATTLDVLSAAEKPSAEIILATLSNELALAPRRFVLVLDDYHTVGGRAVHDLLAGLLRHWPSLMHLVLISRNNPPLPLARLRANGQVVEIRSRDLRFTSGEIADFMGKAFASHAARPEGRATPSPSTLDALIAMLEERTEGWVAGLQLAALALTGADDPEAEAANLEGVDAGIADYLVDEVLSQQTAEVQEFLLLTSILDRFCAGLCEAVVASRGFRGDVRACLDWLVQANLFVIPLDNQGAWYRYHHLFQAILQRRLLAEVGGERVSGLHRAAAAWFAGNHLVDEAVHHALAAHDPDLAAQFMEGALCDVLNRDDRPTLERWLRLLPDEVIERRPGMLMIKAWAFQLSWQPQAQTKVLEQIEVLIRGDGGATLDSGQASILHGQMLALYGQAAFFCNDNARAIALCREGLALLPPDWLYVRGGHAIYLGLAMHASGQGPAAERQLLDFYESLGHKATGYGLRVLVALCFVYLQEGQLDQVRQTALSILAQSVQAGLVIPRFWAHYFLGMVHFHRNDLEQAQQHFGAVVQVRFITQALTVRFSSLGLALTQQARGLSAEALQTLDSLSEFDLQTRGAEDPRTRSLRARLKLLQGDLEGAATWADTFTAPPPEQPLLWLEEPHLTKVRILLCGRREGDAAAALQLLDALDEITQRTHNRRFQIEILALRALALDQTGETGDALAALLQAVQLSRAGGFTRLFVDMGTAMQSMLERLLRRGAAVETVRRILAAFPKPAKTSASKVERLKAAGLEDSSPQAGQVVVERLTGRELDVLLLLRERLSNKEIARALSLSSTTVKRHTANIYGKLGVNRRWDAVIKAEALGILPPR